MTIRKRPSSKPPKPAVKKVPLSEIDLNMVSRKIGGSQSAECGKTRLKRINQLVIWVCTFEKKDPGLRTDTPLTKQRIHTQMMDRVKSNKGRSRETVGIS